MVETRRTLPVIGVLAGVIQLVWRERTVFARSLAMPLGAWVLFALVMMAFPADSGSSWRYLLVLLVYGGVFTMVAVTCHRLALLGPSAVPAWGLQRWTRRETRFLGWVVAGYAVALVMMMVLGTVLFTTAAVLAPVGGTHAAEEPALVWMPWLSLLMSLLPLYLLARLSPLLPATAVDERRDMAWAFEASRGNGWRLLLIVFGLPWLLGMARNILVRSEATSVEVLAVSLLGLVLLPVEVAALSVAYRFLTKGTGQSSEATL